MTRNKVAVACFLWGQWPEDRPDLGREYARKLRRSVFRHSTTPYDWYEFGDYGQPFTSEFKKYRWNLKKMFMFSKESELIDYDWVVALDLDLVIVGSVDFLLDHRSKDLVTCRGAYDSMKPGGSIIGFDPKQSWTSRVVDFLRGNRESVESSTRGSERRYYYMLTENRTLGKIQFWQDQYPDKIVSYKVDGYVPEASVVRFHGKPRPHQVDEFWVKEFWR